jgi:hypothetical protein
MTIWTSELLTERAATYAREDTDEAPMRFPFRLAARLAMVLVGALGDGLVTSEEGDAIEAAYDAFAVAFKEWREGRRAK